MPRNGSIISLSSGALSIALAAILSFASQANPASGMGSAKASQQTAAETQAARSADPSACKGILGRPDTLKASLPGVPKYQKTFVLLLAGSAKEKITSPTSPDLADLPIEINDEPQAIGVTESLHLTNVRRAPVTEQSPVQPLADLAAAKTEAVIMWGPLAGAGLIDLGLEDKVAVFSVDRPRDPPAEFGVPVTGVQMNVHQQLLTTLTRLAFCPLSYWCPSIFGRSWVLPPRSSACRVPGRASKRSNKIAPGVTARMLSPIRRLPLWIYCVPSEDSSLSDLNTSF